MAHCTICNKFSGNDSVHPGCLDSTEQPKPRRLANEVLERIVAEVPEGTEFHRVAKHVLASLVYQAPEGAWGYASDRMKSAFLKADQLHPHPEWFDRAVAIWLGNEGQAIS